jgi:DtxR family transcriptional regulator, Mn-dependent transcriptional regulator
MASKASKRHRRETPTVPAPVNGQGTSESSDDYLKAILELSGPEDRQVASTDVAVHLKVSGASVTKMLQKLSSATPPLVIYEKHHGVRLAKAGRMRALEIVRHHRLIETFLYQVLDYPWDEVHDEAERLEHFISERFEARVAAKLNYPDFDPHGHAIPTLDGSLPAGRSQTLAQTKAKEPVQVASVSDRDPEMLRYLGSHGIKPGVRLKIIERLPFRGAYRVLIGSSREAILLSESLASAIFVNS